LPKLERYVSLYKKDGKEYYGYLDAEYVSPQTTTNYISNPGFNGTTGWTGISLVKNGKPPKVEEVLGRFNKIDEDNSVFISAKEDLESGKFSGNEIYNSYLRVEFTEEE
jgi:hypothetical protein